MIGVQVDHLPFDKQKALTDLLVESLHSGQSVNWLERRIRPLFPAGHESRSVANTFIAWAVSVTELRSYMASNTKAEWLAVNNSCRTCLANQSAGPVLAGQPFPSGHLTPPAHLDCRCCLVPYVDVG